MSEPVHEHSKEQGGEPTPTDEIKHISIKEFRELGFVQEVNRLCLHPCGLALEVGIAEEPATYVALTDESVETLLELLRASGDPSIADSSFRARTEVVVEELLGRIRVSPRYEVGDEFLTGVWDYREDPEGILYGAGQIDYAKVAQAKALFDQHATARISMMGHVIQQPDWPLADEVES